MSAASRLGRVLYETQRRRGGEQSLGLASARPNLRGSLGRNPRSGMRAADHQGLYDPALAKASCGVGFIADIKGKATHGLIEDALAILCNLEHRGAVGADPRAGDGAGILVQIPHLFFAAKAERLGFRLPKPREYAVGVLFVPRAPDWRQIIRDIWGQMIRREGMTLLGWREVPTDSSTLGEAVKPTEPVHLQVFIGRGKRIGARTSSSAACTCCASRSRTPFIRARSAVSPTITRSRSPAAPPSTRACSSRTSSAPIIPTCMMRVSRARLRSCTSASPPTPSPPGRSRIPTA